MANFDAKIKLLVDAEDAYRALAKFEKNIQGLTDKTGAAKFLKDERQRVRVAEKNLKKALDLTSATELYERRLREAARAGTFENKIRGKAVEAAKRVAEANKDNVTILNRVNTLLGRINEKQREVNRNALARDRGQRALAAANAEIKKLREIGFTEGRLREIENFDVETEDPLDQGLWTCGPKNVL